jgi:hypothetical protein
MTARDPVDDPDAAFADAVIDLYNRIRQNIPEEPGSKPPSPDVAAVAFPFATFREALDILEKKLLENPTAENAGKIKTLMPALHLFDSLLRGTEHPFWRFMEGMKISHRRPPSEVELFRRRMTAGLLRALTRAFGPRSASRAGVMIETGCRKRGWTITSRQLSEWETELSTDPEVEL